MFTQPFRRFFQTEKAIVSAILLTAFLLTSVVVFADDITNQVTVGNATPSIGTISANGGSDLTMTENTTTNTVTTVTVSDSNGCSGISSVTLDLFRSGVGTASCDVAGEADNNSCYPAVTCTATTTGNTCTGGADTSVDYDCSVSLQYYADATDAGSTFVAQNWIALLTVGDGTGTTTASSTFEVNSLLALDVAPGSLDYGAVPAGTDTGAANSQVTVTNTGNVDLDPDISGTDMSDGGNTIAAAQQEYSAVAFTYGAGTNLSSTTPAQINITLPQGTSGTVPVTDTVEWGVGVPGGTANGTYTGTTTFAAAAGI